DAAVVRRRIRRPTEPRGDREIRGGYGNRGSRDLIPSAEVPRPTDLASDVCRPRQNAVMSMTRQILHPPGDSKALHVVLQDNTNGRRRQCHGGNLSIGEHAGEDKDLVDVSGEITLNP